MKTRASLGLATAVSFALILLVLPTTGIGQGKTRDIPVDVTFRNDLGDMIGGDTVAARIASNGSLMFTDNDDTGHRVHVGFSAPTTPAPDPFNCKEWGPTPFTWNMAPAFDLSTPRTIQIFTLNQFEYTDRYGWVPVMNPPPKKGTATAHILDLRKDVPPGEKRYVQVMIRLFVNSSNDMYEIWMNRVWPTESGYAHGIFEIEASKSNAGEPGASGDTFTIRPVVAGQPYPLQGLSQNEALLYMVDYSEGGLDPSGPCNMGNFMMPFEMYVTRK